MPFIQMQSFTNLSPPLISRACRFRSAVNPGSFPPGEAKRRLRELIPFNVPIHSGNGGELRVPIIYKPLTVSRKACMALVTYRPRL